MSSPIRETSDQKALGENARGDLRDLLRKSGASLVLKVAGGLAGFSLTLVAGRLLGTNGSGLFFLSLAIVTVIAAISRVGLDQAITRFVSQAQARSDWDSINGLYSRSMLTVLAVSALFATSLFLAAPPICLSVFQEPLLVPVFRWMSLSIVGFAVAWIHAHFFQGLEKIKLFQTFQNLGLTAMMLLTLGVVYSISPSSVRLPVTFAQCFFWASIVTAASAHFTWTRNNEFSWSGSLTGWTGVRPVLATFLGMTLLQQLSNWLPQISLGILCPSEEVGIYNSAFRVANLTSLVLLGVNSVVFPKFAALYSSGELTRLKDLAQSSARLMALACLPFLALLLFFPAVVLGLFGTGFTEGALALQILAVGQLMNVITGSVGGLLNMSGHQDIGLRCSLASFLCMLLLLFLLTPVLGLIGTAIAQAAGVILNMFLLSVSCARRLGFAPVSGSLSFRKKT